MAWVPSVSAKDGLPTKGNLQSLTPRPSHPLSTHCSERSSPGRGWGDHPAGRKIGALGSFKPLRRRISVWTTEEGFRGGGRGRCPGGANLQVQPGCAVALPWHEGRGPVGSTELGH